MTFVKMPKYLPTNKYQNKDLAARVLTIAIGSGMIGETAYFITDCMAWLVSLPIVAIPCYILLHRMIDEETAGQAGTCSA